jgi:hypothetical protein
VLAGHICHIIIHHIIAHICHINTFH